MMNKLALSIFIVIITTFTCIGCGGRIELAERIVHIDVIDIADPPVALAEPVVSNDAGATTAPSTEPTSDAGGNAADASTDAGMTPAPFKSVPTVLKEPLSTTTLANIELDLVKFWVGAAPSGDIAWKQIFFHIAHSQEVKLSSFCFKRGMVVLHPAIYAITVNADDIIVAFNEGQEEVIAGGTGTMYSLNASVSGAKSGSWVNIAIAPKETSVEVGKLELLNAVSYSSTYAISSGLTAASIPTTFLWSDMSAVPHSAALGTNGGSSDWTNGKDIQGLDIQALSQTLTL